MIEDALLARADAWRTGGADGHLVAASACVEDFLACLLLGRRRAQVGGLLDEVRFGGARAALVHAGTVCHALEWDDSMVRSVVHPAVVVVAPALATATDIRSLLRGVGAGYDIVGYLGEVTGEAHYARWLHPTPCLGPYGGSAAAAVALGATERLRRAFGLVPSFASGSMSFLQDGSWTKGIQTGWANGLAIDVLELAARPFPVPSAPLSGRGGLGESFEVMEWPDPIWDDGDSYVNHVVMKPYPSCRLTHGAIECALELALPEEEIDAITLALSPRAHAIVGAPDGTKRAATELVERQFSAHYCAAAALVAPEHFGDALLGDDVPGAERIRALAECTTAVVDETLPLDGCRMTVHTGSQTVEAEVGTPLGDPTRPLDEASRRRKWRIAAGDDAEGDRIAVEVAAALLDLETAVDRLLAVVDPASELRTGPKLA